MLQSNSIAEGMFDIMIIHIHYFPLPGKSCGFGKGSSQKDDACYRGRCQ